MEQWKRKRSPSLDIILLIVFLYGGNCCKIEENFSGLDKELVRYVDDIFSVDNVTVIPGIGIERRNKDVEDVHRNDTDLKKCDTPRKSMQFEDYFYDKWNDYTDSHIVKVNLTSTARFFGGKSSFFSGFMMGFLAFGLKKLLLPVFIGAQLIKSVLIAMFLPSILGSFGKIVGKGLSTFSGVSGSSAGLGGAGAGAAADHVEDFDFKDTGAYNNEAAESTLSLNLASSESPQQAMNRFGYGYGNSRISYANHNSDYYLKQPNKKTDYKVFHRIPSSSMLLTTYDPFYSPLLSRLDAVFQQLGLGSGKLASTEKCRERLVCLMYANPAKYAPYSNLVSAQLSRELNELRKPASDNPEILRFFRYMKAAKDGQDGEECLAHGGCPSLTAHQPSPAMLTTYNDINKLVQARKFK